MGATVLAALLVVAGCEGDPGTPDTGATVDVAAEECGCGFDPGPQDVPAPVDVPGDAGTADGTPSDVVPTDVAPDVAPADIPPATLGKVSPAAMLAELASKDFLLINVHVPYDGQIPGTDRHLTYLDVDAIAAYIGADLDRKTVVYCLSNYMSLIAGNALVERGYRAVRYLDGGMGAWKSAGYPFEE